MDKRLLALLLLSFPFLCTASLAAREEQDPLEQLRRELEEVRRELEESRSSYEARISRLEERLGELETGASPESVTEKPGAPAFEFPPPPATSEAPATAPQEKAFSGGERSLQALNPEISVTGDVTGRLSDNSSDREFNRFNFDGFEMALQHPLDPYSEAKFFLAFEDGEFSLEEGYITYSALPGRLGLKVGRFHTNFGKLNRYHKHALPWADRDLPTRTFFGDEGLIGTGFSLSWLPPRLPIAQSNELTFELVNNDNESIFSGRGFGDPVYIGRLLNYYDLNENAYLEWGASAATSHWDEGKRNRSTVYGLDISYRWQPLRRALYRSFEWRSEVFYNQRANSAGGNPFGFYSSGEYQLSRRWFAGLRVQFSEEFEDTDEHVGGISPFLTFWQSEFVRFRAQYDFLDPSAGEAENRFFFQLTWSLGPHKHEAY